MSDSPPASIGIYQILNEIGRGATARVFLAKNTANQDIVCCKILEKKQLFKDEELAFFKREVSIISSLDHPNIVKYYDLLEDTKRFYLIMIVRIVKIVKVVKVVKVVESF